MLAYEPEPAESGDLIRNGIQAYLRLLENHAPQRSADLQKLLEEEIFVNLIAMDIDLEDPRSFEILIAGAFSRAVESLSEEELEKLLKGEERPCCSDYPLIWPFCNPKC